MPETPPPAMQAFRVADMHCRHCISLITRSILAVDRDATVTIDLAHRLVMVEPIAADPDDLREAIVDAGYTPARVVSATVVASPSQAGA